jgi:hypothetical protein
MTTTPTNKPVGSEDPRDLYFNAGSLDIRTNSTTATTTPDRFGVQRKTWLGMESEFDLAQQARNDNYNLLLAASGFELPPLVYADGSPLTVDRATQLIEREGLLYGVKLPALFPVELSGAWASDESLLVVRADQALREQLANDAGPSQGASLIGYSGRTVADVLSGFVRPQDKGAVGDGVTDDSAAVLATILDGRPVDWGSATYRVTSEVDQVITHRIYWVACGARIVYDAPAPTQNVIKLKVSPHDHVIKGVLGIDANRKAFNGIWLLSAADTVDTATAPLSYPNLIADDLQVTRAYRASTAFTGGNGILVEGAWNKVGFLRPVITDCRMAAGAEVSGEQGIFGLSVMRIGSSSLITPYEITVIDPYIDGITSEDNTYQMDQDGIRLFTSYNQGVVRGTEFSWSVIGGVIRNCRNREIKGQSNAGRVIGTKLVRTDETGGAATGNSPAIDQQVGPVTITNLEFFFRGHAPLSIASDRTRVEDYVQAGTQISGVKGLLSGNTFLPYFFFAGVEAGAPSRHRVTISDVDVQHQGSARIGYFLQMQTSNVTGAVQGGPKPSRIMLTNISCMVRDAWINAIQVGGGSYTVDMVNNHNTFGANIPILTDSAPSASRTVSALNCTGFASTARLQPGDVGNETRIAAIAPVGVGTAGLTRPIAFTLADGESYTIPISAMASAGISNVLLLAGSRPNPGSHGMFFCGSQSVQIANAGVTDWVAGGESEPAAGLYRIWASPSGIVVKNMQGSTRTFSGLLIG